MASGYLYQDDVVFYHPCDDLTEHKEGKTWINYGDNLYFTDGVIVSGVTRTSDYNGRLESTDAAYPGCSGDNSWTFACWIRDDTAYNQEMWGGWYNGTGYDNLLRLKLGSTPHVQIRILAGGISDDFAVKAHSPIGSGLYVAHVEFYGSTASGWISHNGSGWIDCGEVDVDQPDEQYDRVVCGKYNYTNKVGNAILDEVVFWHNTPQFTDAELLNLYNLFHESGLTMNHYRPLYGPWDVAELTPLTIHGRAVAPGDAALQVWGHVPVSGEDASAFVRGHAVSDATAPLVVHGRDDIDDDAHLSAWGHATAEGDTPLCTVGLGWDWGSAP